MDTNLTDLLNCQEVLKNLLYLASYEYSSKGVGGAKLSDLRKRILETNDEIKQYCISKSISYPTDSLLDPLKLLNESNVFTYNKALAVIGDKRSELEKKYLEPRIVKEPTPIKNSNVPKTTSYSIDKSNIKAVDMLDNIKKLCASVEEFSWNVVNNKNGLAMLGEPIIGIKYCYSQDYVENLIDTKSPDLDAVISDIREGVIRDLLTKTGDNVSKGRENTISSIKNISRAGTNLMSWLQEYANSGLLPKSFANLSGITYENFEQLLEFSKTGTMDVENFEKSTNSLPTVTKGCTVKQDNSKAPVEGKKENKKHYVSKYTILADEIKELNNLIIDIMENNGLQKQVNVFNDVYNFIISNKDEAYKKYDAPTCKKIIELNDKINLFLNKYTIGVDSTRVERINRDNPYQSLEQIRMSANKRKDLWPNIAKKGLTTISTLAISGVMYASPTVAAATATGVAFGADQILKQYEKKHESKKWYKTVHTICATIERAGLGAIITKMAWPVKGIIMGTGGLIGGASLYKAKHIKNLDSEELNKSGKITGIIKKKLNDKKFLTSLATNSLSVSAIALAGTISQALSNTVSGLTEIPLEEIAQVSR